MQISIIEDLFQVQTNAFRLANRNIYLRTPLLAIVTAFCWLVPIATIYPPGALVVGIQASASQKNFTVSVLHHKSLLEMGEVPSITVYHNHLPRFER